MTNSHLSKLETKILGLGHGRQIIALSGPPASGKSTLAQALVTSLNQPQQHAILVPMDGFHLDNSILAERRLLDQKGAPESFDAEGFVALVKRLKTSSAVIFPNFDRARDIAISGSISVEEHHRYVVIEGNYLCFDEPPWATLQTMWDLSAYLDVPEDTLKQRLVDRWVSLGYSKPQAEQRVVENDLVNFKRLNDNRLPVDLILKHTSI